MVFPFFGVSAFSSTLDFGVDPERLGTGEWVYVMNTCVKQLGGSAEEVNDAPSMFRFFKKQGIDYVAVKAGTGAKDFPSQGPAQFTPELVKQAHDAGLRIFGYTRSDGKDVPGEIALACKVNAMGADGFIIDAEAEWEASRLEDKGPQRAIQLCQGIRKAYPTRFLGHAPMPIISKHSSFPYKEFGRYCDATMPQAYWKSIGVTPKRMVEWMENEWHTWNASLTNEWKQAIKPLAPIAQAWSPTEDRILRGVEIVQFANELKAVKNPASPTGYKGISYWRCDLHSKEMWKAVRRVEILNSRPTELDDEDKVALVALEKAAAGSQSPNDLIIDNNSDNASFEGKWFPGKMKPNHFGPNYECVGSVAGQPTAKAIFRPKITKAGNYDVYAWYPSDLSKSGKVPYTINHQDKSERVIIDQTTNGGQWTMIAAEKFFDAGSDGYVSIGNDLGDDKSIIVADAIRFRLSVLPDQAPPPKEALEASAPALAPVPAPAVAAVPPPVPAVTSKTPVPVPIKEPAPAPTPKAATEKAAAQKPEIKNALATSGIAIAKAEIIMGANDATVTYTGNWHEGKMGSGFYTQDYQWTSTTDGPATATATFQPDIRVAGLYNVYTWHTISTNRSRNAHWEIHCADGDETAHINQRAHGGRWVLLAKHKQFAVGKSGYIRLSNDTGERGAGQNIVIADAVRLVLKAQDKDEGNETASAAKPGNDTAAKFAESERDILLDNLNPEVAFEGRWNPESTSGCFGADCLSTKAAYGTATATATAVYRPTINAPGDYDVYIWYPQSANNSTNAQWLVSWNGGNAMVNVDQTKNGGQWLLIASAKPFAVGNRGSVTLFNDTNDAARDRKVVADAVRFRLRAGQVSSSSR